MQERAVKRKLPWKKAGCWLGIIFVFLLLCVGYDRFLEGPAQIDPALVSEENLELLAENWEKLLESGEFVEGYQGLWYYYGNLFLHQDREEQPERWIWADTQKADGSCEVKFCIDVYGEPLETVPTLDGHNYSTYYRRNSLRESMFYNYGSFGVRRETYFEAVSGHCVVSCVIYDREDADQMFDELMRRALAIAGA